MIPEARGRSRNEAPARERCDERQPEAGIGRPGGIVVMLVSAATVFLIGKRLFPVDETPELPPPAAADASAAETGFVPPGIADAGAVEAAVAEAGLSAEGGTAGDAGPTAESPAISGAPSADADSGGGPGSEDPTGAPRIAGALDPQQKLEKEIAREAWRKNAPDIRVVGRKAVMVIPIKGSIEEASHKLRPRTRTIEVKLPKAASLATLRFYRGKDGFKQLWVEQEEKTVNPEKGATLKVVLHESVGPKVEIKEDFVRVTIPRRRAHPAASKEESAAPEGGAEAEPAPIVE